MLKYRRSDYFQHQKIGIRYAKAKGEGWGGNKRNEGRNNFQDEKDVYKE